MTPKQFERMAKCDHRKTCGRLVTLKASSYADPYHWCICGECPYYTTENAELREFAHLVAEYTSAGQCEGCVAKRACSAGELDMCWIRKAILEKLRELGVDVP